MLEQLPRADDEHLSTLSTLYNTTIRQLVAAAPAINQCKLVVASHASLNPATQEPALRTAVFGSPSARGTDGIHYRGKEGSTRHTSSVIAALKSAGLGGWSYQGPRGAARPQTAATYSQVVQTNNQFEGLNY